MSNKLMKMVIYIVIGVLILTLFSSAIAAIFQ